MTVSRAFTLTALVLATAGLTAPSTFAEPQARMPLAKSDPGSAGPFVQMAQKADGDETGDEKDKKGRRPPGKDGKNGKGAGGPPGKDQKKSADQKPPKKDGKPNAFNKKPVGQRPDAVNIIPKINAEAARKKKEQQLKALQAKEDALKKARDAKAARDKANAQKQLDAKQAKENTLKKARDAQAARDKANAQKQIDAKQAKEDALKKARDAKAARDKANAQKQFEAKQAKEKASKKTAGKRPAKFDRSKADQEFDRARKNAQQKSGGPNEKWRADSARKFEDLRKGRKTREVGSREIIVEQDKRVIVRGANRNFIRHDEGRRFVRSGKEVRRERRKDGTWMVITAGLAGAMIYSILDDDGRALRRSRRDRDGREYVMFDDRRSYRDRDDDYYDDYIDLPPPVVRIPRDRYIVDYDNASVDDIYDALNAPPVEELERGYSLDEVRQNYSILERMRRVDLNAINFEFASWDVGEDQYPKLERIARAMHRVLDRSPGELFFIEGHTDAVGNDIDNLSLSDRRAETVAIVLTDTFGIPSENLATQGYGEEYLKELTDGPSFINRRVGVRRITPLLSREGWDDDDGRG